MGNFWAERLGISQQQQPAPAAQPAAPQGPWWANASYTSGQPSVVVQDGSQQVVSQPEQGGTWGTVEGSMRKAKSASLKDTCPECGSSNYGRPLGKKNHMAQCQECGYNDRFGLQSGSDPISRDAGPARPSKQLVGTGARGMGGWNPTDWQDPRNIEHITTL